jgi:deazaflavin-dependent oxidoreductase (nitroreductase family)
MTIQGLASVSSQKFIHLTTIGRKTQKPHIVELWFAARGNIVYLSHEGMETHWMKNIEKNGNVTFEIGGENFAGKARLLEDRTEECWAAKVALYEKYYGEAFTEIIEDWFSLSRLLAVELT